MKLFMNKNERYEEPEVHMFFHKQTKEVEQVEKFVRSLSITIPAKYEDEIYKLYLTDIQIEDLKILLDVDISSGKSGSSGTLHLENPIAIILYMV